jgi:hypothetical protein
MWQRIMSSPHPLVVFRGVLQALSDEHFGYAPDDVTWSHVGSLEHYAELLKRITDSAFREGEHAA